MKKSTPQDVSWNSNLDFVLPSRIDILYICVYDLSTVLNHFKITLICRWNGLLVRVRIQSPGAGPSWCRSRCGPARIGPCGRIQPWPEWPGRCPPSPGSHSCFTAGCHCSEWGMYDTAEKCRTQSAAAVFWLLSNVNFQQEHWLLWYCGNKKTQLIRFRLTLAEQPRDVQRLCNSDTLLTSLLQS